MKILRSSGLDDEKGLVHHELEKSCGCPENCYISWKIKSILHMHMHA